MTSSRSVIPLLRGGLLAVALAGLHFGACAQWNTSSSSDMYGTSSDETGQQNGSTSSNAQGTVTEAGSSVSGSSTVRLQSGNTSSSNASSTQKRSSNGSNSTSDERQRRLNGDDTQDDAQQPPEVARPDEFEVYLRKLGYRNIKRFGQELMAGRGGFDAPETSGLVPADYVIGANDELHVTIWGSADADLRLQVDRSGRITIPRIGAIPVAGVKFGDVTELISRRVGQVFRNYQVSVTLGQVRSVRVYVTGHVKRPGVYNVSALSSVVSALMRSGGPTAAGSLRLVDLRRGKDLVTRYDLYDLLVKGDRSADRVVQNGDVIHIGPVGAQVALVGSVNRPAIFELKAGETIDDLLTMAGGFTAVADRSRLSIERLDERAKTRVAQLELPGAASQAPASGDVLRAFSAVEATQPVARQNKRIRIEGEVLKPGEYVLPPNVTVSQALGLAGGLTSNAYLYGTEFTRESVRQQQQVSYDRALRDMETEFARSSATQRAISADEAATFEQRNTATTRLIEKLRQVRPTGRVVLQMTPGSDRLPDLALEDGDRILVPARPTTVNVFGSVFSSGAFLQEKGRSFSDYLNQAGGPTRGADDGAIFVLRPNGSVVSQLQRSSFFGLVGDIGGTKAEPGDTIFVPERMNKTTWVQDLKEWTQILYQFGLGAAALKTLQN
ncbi:MAG: polysaccharide biosynthesis/export protein [Pseudomonadota bacterium]|nr:polysaccharide biosynthesis/export protein [Pseudomonadota bacterium]